MWPSFSPPPPPLSLQVCLWETVVSCANRFFKANEVYAVNFSDLPLGNICSSEAAASASRRLVSALLLDPFWCALRAGRAQGLELQH